MRQKKRTIKILFLLLAKKLCPPPPGKHKMHAFVSTAAKCYRTDEVAILRSFVICRAPLTLQRTPTVALISSFMESDGKEEEKKERWRDDGRRAGAVVFFVFFFGNKDNIYAAPWQRQLRETQTWKSIMERFLKV